MITTTYLVSGMTCGHCVSAVTEEIGKLDGVTGVEVDLVAGGDVPGHGDQHDRLSAAPCRRRSTRPATSWWEHVDEHPAARPRQATRRPARPRTPSSCRSAA